MFLFYEQVERIFILLFKLTKIKLNTFAFVCKTNFNHCFQANFTILDFFIMPRYMF